MSTEPGRVGRWRPDPMTVAVAVLVVFAELAFLTAYLQVNGAGVTDPVLAIGVPFVWVNLSLLVAAFVRPAPDAGRRLPAVAIAAGYFLVLAVAGGVLLAGDGSAFSWRVQLGLVPGWSPLVVATGGPLTVAVIPFKLTGYLALTYLVYVTVRDASGALVGGLLGLFSCVSCTLPIIAGIVSTLAGGSAFAATAYSNSYVLSTVVFAVTVGLLAWRPTVGSLRGVLDR